ncbi:MAG TPA: hypothetical protein VJ756_22020 [Terriglobales bacterium]|jgi:hypothetical protein|nr:hypothetical protein [Terriglobales bacterium]
MTGATAMHAAALDVEEYVCAETIRRIAVVPQTLSNWWRRPPWPLRAAAIPTLSWSSSQQLVRRGDRLVPEAAMLGVIYR